MRRRSTLSNVMSTLVGLAAVVSLAGNAHADVLDDVKTNGTLKCGVTLASAGLLVALDLVLLVLVAVDSAERRQAEPAAGASPL